MARNGSGLVLPGPAQLPKTQELLFAVIEQNAGIIQLLNNILALSEAQLRVAVGQSEEDLRFAQNLTLPVPTEEERKAILEAEAQAKLDREELAAELQDEVGAEEPALD